MALRPLKWFFSNQFVHLDNFLMPSARHKSVPALLRQRLERRLRTAMRLARWRIVLYVLIYSTILSGALALFFEGLGSVVDSDIVPTLGKGLLVLLRIASPLSIVALLALVPVNRTLVLLGADIQVLGMEVVSRNVAAGGVLPSQQAPPADGITAGDDAPGSDDGK